jgi:hypothetical protein
MGSKPTSADVETRIAQACAFLLVFPIRLGYRLGIISAAQRKAVANRYAHVAAQLAAWRQERG